MQKCGGSHPCSKCMGAMQKRLLVIWAGNAHIEVTPGARSPPISPRRVFPSGGFAYMALPQLSRIVDPALFLFRRHERVQDQAALLALITSSASRPVSSAIWSKRAL